MLLLGALHVRKEDMEPVDKELRFSIEFYKLQNFTVVQLLACKQISEVIS